MIITTKETWSELLHNAGVYDALQLNENEEFAAECSIVNFWNMDIQADTGCEGYKLESATTATDENGNNGVSVNLIHESGEILSLLYVPDPEHPGQHSLMIVREDALIYSRFAWHDPRTEWDINCVADDPTVTDADGNMLFEGDPVNI